MTPPPTASAIRDFVLTLGLGAIWVGIVGGLFAAMIWQAFGGAKGERDHKDAKRRERRL